MKKLTRILVIVASFTAVLVVIGVAALPGIVALNKVKGEIAETLSRATGRSVTIQKLSLSLYPWLGIRLAGATIGNAAGFGAAPFAHVDDAVVEVRLLPLFARHIVLRRIVLTGLSLDLRVDKAGRTNWATFTSHKPPRAPIPVAAPQAAIKAPTFALLKAAGLTVKNARIDYRDARTGGHVTLTRFMIRSGAIAPNRPVAITLAGILEAQGHGSFPFRIQTRLSHKGNNVVFDPFRLSIATLNAVGALSAGPGPKGFVADGHLHVPAFAPRPLLTALGLHYVPRDPRALQAASGDVAFQLSPDRLELAPLRLKVDGTVMTGSVVRIGRPLLYRVHLAVGSLAPMAYLPAPARSPVPQGVAARAPVPPSGSPPPAPFPLPLQGGITIASLRVHGLTLTHVVAGLDSRAGRVSLQPLTAILYGGTLAGALAANTVPSPLTWRSHAHLQQVHIGALLRALHLFPELSGSLDVDAALHGSGTALPLVERSLTGRMKGSIQHGVLRGLDLDTIAHNPTAAAGGRRASHVEGTTFSDLGASATIDHGVMDMQKLSIHTARAVASGHGTVSLPTKTINYLINVTLPSGLVIPVRVQGPVGRVRFSVSLNRLLSNSRHNGSQPALKDLRNNLKKLFGIH